MEDSTLNGAAAEVIARERVRAGALLAGDRAAMARLLADEFTYTHSTGKTDDRASYLAAFGTRYAFVSVAHDDLSVRHYGEAAVLTGNLDVVLAPVGGSERLSRLRFMGVWIRRQGIWLLAAFQNTARSDG